MSADGGGVPVAPVWDGTAWVAPGTDFVWDGTQWVDRTPEPTPPPASVPAPAATPAPPPPPPPPPPSPHGAAHAWAPAAATAPTEPPVSRGIVFLQMLWRVALECVGGGAVVGFLLIAALLLFPDNDDDTAFSFLLVGPLIGGILGAMLAVVAAPTIAGVGAGVLVPYPGRKKTLLIVRAMAMSLVGLFLLLVLSGAVFDVGVIVLITVISAASLGGAWFLSPWVVNWYIERCEEAAAPTPGTGSRF